MTRRLRVQQRRQDSLGVIVSCHRQSTADLRATRTLGPNYGHRGGRGAGGRARG